MKKFWFIPTLAALVLCFIAGVLVSSSGMAPNVDKAQAATALPQEPPQPGHSRDPQYTATLPPEVELDLTQMTLEGDRYTLPLPDGQRAVLTLDPTLQQQMQQLYERYELPHAAFVAVEPHTGRVLALVSHESAPDRLGNVALSASAPSASVFKTITAAALLEDAKLDPKHKRCYAYSRATPSEDAILGTAPADGCTNLGTAFGLSNNAIFSSLAHEHLDQSQLQNWAARFGFNERLPFQLPLEISRAQIPEDSMERARTAAGFWNTHLTPLHGALISASVANGGIMMRPNLIERVEDAQGRTTYSFQPLPLKRVMQPQTARQLADLMVYTTTTGTASKYFRQSATWPQDYIAAGKTGTLSQKDGDITYNWFVGFAPIHAPEVAISAIVYNPPKWHIKAGYAAARGLSTWREGRLRATAQNEAPQDKDDQATPQDKPKAP